MSVGNPATKQQIDQSLQDLAVGLRTLGNKATNMMTMLNAQGDVQAALEAVGYSADPNPENQGGISDAALAALFVGYMSTLAGVYYGRVQQGGNTADGTGAALFNFDQAFSPLWGGQV